MKLHELLQGIEVLEQNADPELELTGVSYDSRSTAPGELFAAICEDPLLKGVTFSGGEPFCQPEPLTELAKLVHGAGKDVTIFTGYTYEQLLEKQDPAADALLAQCDLLIDGPFILEQRNLELRFRGSENQRLIDMKKTRQAGCVVLLPEE